MADARSGLAESAAELVSVCLEVLLVGLAEPGVEPLGDADGLLAGGEDDVLDLARRIVEPLLLSRPERRRLGVVDLGLDQRDDPLALGRDIALGAVAVDPEEERRRERRARRKTS